ncbi:hypothetical protein Barb6_01437 [Bacteroidales bacterium Barb6]|nr:hypothetical protein Barb6_01437 [Bacteroidales bacterium Barb6]
MRLQHFLFFLILSTFLSCNKEEGIGGSSSLEGYVYKINHYDDNFSFKTDTTPAIKEDVFIVYGDDDYSGDNDIQTDRNGLYRFDYLRKGNYTVYAYSQYATGQRAAIAKKVKVSRDINQADTIFIHTGKAYGTAQIKGSVYALFYDGSKKIDEGPAIDADVYINNYGEDMFFDRIRVGDQGFFIFQKILPGRYEVWTTSEDPDTRKLTPVKQLIEVIQAGETYVLPEQFIVKARA